MIELQKTPPAVIEYFKAKAADFESAILLLRADRGKDLMHRDVWVLLTHKSLYVAEGVVAVGRGKRGFKKQSASAFMPNELCVYSLQNLKKFRTEAKLSGGEFVCTEGGEPLLLFNYSAACNQDVRLLKDALSQLEKDGKANEAKLKEQIKELPYCPKCGRRYTDEKRKVCGYCIDRVGLIKKLSSFFIRYKGYMAMVFLTIALMTGIGLIVPQVSSKMFYNDVLTEGGRHYGRIWYVVGLIAGVRLLSLLVNIANGIINARVSTRVNYDLKNTIYKAINRLSLGFFSSRQTGGLMTQINNDANTIYWFFCDGFPYLVTNAIQLIGVMVIMLFTNVSLTLYTFITVPFSF